MKYNNGRPKNPLNNMIQEAVCAKNLEDLAVQHYFKYKVHVSNPKVATLYCLPKIHKNLLAKRPIASNVNALMEKLAYWFLKT